MVALFTRREAQAVGLTDRHLRRAVERSRYTRLAQGVYFEGDRPPTQFERRLARAMRAGAAVGGELGAALHGFDGFEVPGDGSYNNVPRVSAHQTLLHIAATTTDLRWEWALEWALRKRHTTVGEMNDALLNHRRGNGRIRRVLNLRPRDAVPTESLLETMAVQLIRSHVDLPQPVRQVGVRHWRVDLAWPEHGVFLELDGEQHKDQPRYDASRQTGVVATTGWLVGRYTWTDIVHQPNSTLRSMAMLVDARNAARAG